jgi:asparagine synthetase B (glutamine-hydrolysing)
MKEMDGFFTLVISTANELSVVRDAFACKPAVVAETDGYVAVASEYRALAELPDHHGHRIRAPTRGGLHMESLNCESLGTRAVNQRLRSLPDGGQAHCWYNLGAGTTWRSVCPRRISIDR